MTRDEVLAFVKANPVAFMATVERSSGDTILIFPGRDWHSVRAAFAAA